MKVIEYDKLRLDILQKLVDERNIICKYKKDEMVKYLIMDDENKYVRETTYEKYEKETFIVGIDLKNRNHLVEMGKLVEKKIARSANRFSNNMVYYISNQKLI